MLQNLKTKRVIGGLSKSIRMAFCNSKNPTVFYKQKANVSQDFLIPNNQFNRLFRKAKMKENLRDQSYFSVKEHMEFDEEDSNIMQLWKKLIFSNDQNPSTYNIELSELITPSLHILTYNYKFDEDCPIAYDEFLRVIDKFFLFFYLCKPKNNLKYDQILKSSQRLLNKGGITLQLFLDLSSSILIIINSDKRMINMDNLKQPTLNSKDIER